MTLKKVKLIVEEASDEQYEKIKKIRTKANELEEQNDRIFAWRSDIEDQIRDLS